MTTRMLVNGSGPTNGSSLNSSQRCKGKNANINIENPKPPKWRYLGMNNNTAMAPSTKAARMFANKAGINGGISGLKTAGTNTCAIALIERITPKVMGSMGFMNLEQLGRWLCSPADTELPSTAYAYWSALPARRWPQKQKWVRWELLEAIHEIFIQIPNHHSLPCSILLKWWVSWSYFYPKF